VPDRAVLAQKSNFECRRLSVLLTGVTREEQGMSWLTEHQRLIGRCAWVAAWVGLVVGQLHALSRFATAEGVEDLALPATAAWAVPAAEALSPLLGWGDADLVYVTYGKIWFPLFLAFTLCAFVIYKQRRPGRWETWVWRVALTGYVLACAGVFLWTIGRSGPATTTCCSRWAGS
jgi:hypothetical protein